MIDLDIRDVELDLLVDTGQNVANASPNLGIVTTDLANLTQDDQIKVPEGQKCRITR